MSLCKREHFDLTSFARTDLFENACNAAQTKAADAGIVFLEGFDGRSHSSNNYTGSPFALAVDESQNTYVIDLTNGEKSRLEAFSWRPGMSTQPSCDGKKLLLTGKDEGRLDIGHVAVVDYESRTVVQFYRENPNQISEHMAYWFSPDTMVICSDVDSASSCTDYFFYTLRTGG